MIDRTADAGGEDDTALLAAQAADEPEEEIAGEELEGEAEGEAAAGQPPQQRQAKVPHQALHQEREERKKLSRQLEEERVARARAEERFRTFYEMQQQRPAEAHAEEMPDPNADPVGALNYLLRERQAGRQQEQQTAQQQESARQYQQFVASYKAQAQAFARANPDFDAAYAYLIKDRTEELMLAGYDPDTAAQILQQEEAGIAAAAMRSGVNPGERVMELARRRGWKSQQQPSAKDQVQAIADTQARNRSLSNGGGATAPTEMTAERLLKMSNDEFDVWVTKNPAKAKRIMGG